ncbi:MAG: hypothetical protein L0G70_04580 [Rubrobacter sp.]|nr:hypothetical protein [Rubrobacter sp.]
MQHMYGLAPETISEEERIYYHTALSDIAFARSMLRQVGSEERSRFSQVGWPYGEPEVFGGHPFDAAEAQLCNLLYILFGAGFSGEFFSTPAYDGEEMLDEIAALDGAPLCIQDRHFGPGPMIGAGGDYEEILITEIRAYQTGGPAEGPTGSERMAMLTTALRSVVGEAGTPALHRWRDNSDRGRQRSGDPYYHPDDEHLLLLCGFEPFAPQELMQEYLFDVLLKAYRHRDPAIAPPENDAALEQAEQGRRSTTLAEIFATETR